MHRLRAAPLSLALIMFSAVFLAPATTRTSLAASDQATGSSEPYQEIRVSLAPGTDFDLFLREQLERNPDLEPVGIGEEDARFVSRPRITADLISMGHLVEIVHEDLQAFYSSRQGKVQDYGVWHTYAEMLSELEALHAQYPSITTAPYSIGQSLEGREIWAIKVSDNPDIDEAEPEVLFDGTHHAREIMTLELCLFLIRHLCENYGSDPATKALVDQRQIFFVPVVNPDGFVYNESIAPNGGGMWRKNRRQTSAICRGVDLNRNYPVGWGGTGSSGSPCDETFRGSGPASEPETQVMMSFMNAHRFVTHESIHSFMGAILYPWGYTSAPTPDEERFQLIGRARAADNGYTVARIGVSGCTADFAYGEQTTKPKVMSFLTEIGGSGFWPDPSEKEGLLQENLSSMLYLAGVAGPRVNLETLAVLPDGGDERIDPGETVQLRVRVVNEGLLADASDLRIRLRCDDPYVRPIDVAASADTLLPGASWENTDHPFTCRIDEACPQGRDIALVISADAGGSVHGEIPVTIQVGERPAIYSVDFENGMPGWQVDESQTTATGSYVAIDPNYTPYQPDDDSTPDPGRFALVTGQNVSDSENDVDGGIVAIRSPEIGLSSYQRVTLSLSYFHGQRDGGDDPAGDWFRIAVSSDGGSSWVDLVAIGDQHSLAAWRSLSVDLESVIDLTDRFCLRVQASDGPGESDIVEAGIDEVLLTLPGQDSRPPGAPVPLSPEDGYAAAPPRPTLTVRNAEDPEGEPLRYGFRVFADADQTRLVRSSGEVEGGGYGVTSWTVPIPLDPGTYYWRAYASDPVQRGSYGEVSSFEVVEAIAPKELAAVHAEPNPSRDRIRILYFLPHTLTSRVALYDTQGREVRKLPGVSSAAGWQTVDWDARDSDGRRVPSGSYWLKVWTPEETRTARIVHVE